MCRKAVRSGILALLLLAAWTAPVQAAERLVVYCTNAARGAIELIAPDFERATGNTVKLKFGTTADLRQEIEQGAVLDLALLTDTAVDDLIARSQLLASGRVIAFRSGVGIGVRKGAATPSISTAAKLRSVLLQSKSIAITAQGVSGPIIRNSFEKLGIAAAMAPKILLVSDVTAPEAVAQGRAELGVAQVSELLGNPQLQLLGQLPGDLQSLSSFAAAISVHAAAVPTAQAFIAFLARPAAKQHMRTLGLQP